MEKMANTESRSVSFFGDKDDYWFKMIQRNWHGSLETFRMASDRRRGMNNILYESGGEGAYTYFPFHQYEYICVVFWGQACHTADW